MNVGIRASAISAAAGLCAFACGTQQEVAAAGEEQLTFHQAPQITIDSPRLGAHVATTKDGYVDVIGKSRGSALTINGAKVAVDGNGAFHARVKAAVGLNVITARLGSLWGGEAQRAFLYGDFAAPGTKMPSGVMVRSTSAAFGDHDGDLDDFSAIARAMLLQADPMKYLGQLPPITYGFGIGSVDVSVTGVQFAKDQTVLGLAPRAVGAHLDGSFANLVLNLHLVLHFLGSHPSDAVVSVDTVGFVGDIDASFSPTAQIPDPQDPGHTLTGPGIVGAMEKPAIALGNLNVTTSLDFPGVDAFLSWLANRFRATIADNVATQIQQNAANHFAAALNQFGLPTSFNLQPLGVNATVDIADELDARTSFDADGNTLSASTNLSWPSLPPGAPGAAAPGSLFLNSAPAGSFPQATLGVSVSIDAVNQAAFAVWGQGALDRVVYPARNYWVFKMDPVVASPKLAPVISAGANGQLQLSLGDIVVTSMVHTLIFDGPLKATISANANVTVDIDPATNALRMTLAGKPTIWLDVNDLLGVVPDALLAPLSQALQAMAPTIVANLVKPVEMPLPALPLQGLVAGAKGSLGLSAPIAVAVDAGHQRVTVTGDLAIH